MATQSYGKAYDRSVDDPQSLPLRRTLGPYRLLRRIGVGGMAEVYAAKAFGASGFEKRIALKTPLPRVQENHQLLRLLIEEARIGAQLHHRNLVAVHDLGVADGVYYIRMDYIDGPDLRTVLAHGRLPPELAVLIAEELARGLDYVHNACDETGRPLGLVHRDVSPSNILISSQGEVKLADFGIAKATVLADTTRGDARKGKYAYMSPEQVQGVRLSHRSDQFSLAVTLVEMLTGRRPYEGASPLETMELIRRAEPIELLDVQPSLRELVARCLAAEPYDRYASTAEVREVLGAVRRTLRGAEIEDLRTWVRARVN